MTEKIISNPGPKEIALKWIEAYNSRNTENIVLLYDDNVTNIQMPRVAGIQGKEEIRKTYDNLFRAFPDIYIKAESILEDGLLVAIEWIIGGTLKGEYAGYEPNGNKFIMRGCEVFEVMNGKIKIQRGYWDKDTMFSQLKLEKR